METNLFPHAVVAVALILAVAALAVWRKMVASREDDSLHVLGDAQAVSQQSAVAKRLEFIDKWGKLLTIIVTVYSIVIAVIYVYQHWVRSSGGSLR